MSGSKWLGVSDGNLRFVGGGGGGEAEFMCVTEKEREGQQDKGSAVYVWTCLYATGWEMVSGLNDCYYVARVGRKDTV